ncbi:MAG: flagellar filament capping protein FliD [Spirochaetales bacterium]|nr:flagellar filament capping protein FliD [Spirochaetales bacterium]
MSDITIPGVTGKIDTKGMIKAIMDAERVPLERMQGEVDTYKKNKRVWLDLNLNISKFKESAADLWGHNNPFNAKKAKSSNESILTAIATRKAIIDEKQLKVKQIATADRFMSMSLPRDFTVKAGQYTFQIGDKEFSFKFKGGDLEDFAEAINTKADKYLKATVVNNTSDTRVILIESLKTGSKNKLTFKGTAAEFGEEAGMFKRQPTVNREISLESSSIEKTGSTTNNGIFRVQDGELTVDPGTSVTIPVKPPFTVTRNMVLEYEVKTSVLKEGDVAAPETPPGPDVPDVGFIEYKGIKVYNEKSIVILPDEEVTPPPARVDDLNVIAITSKGNRIKLPAIVDTQNFQKVTVPIGELADSIDSIIIDNKNTHRTVSARNFKITDPTQRGDYVPTNALSESKDAIIELNGIEIIRETNEIDDVVPEVTLYLHDAGDEKIKLQIKNDEEAIKSSVIAFVGNYNRLLTEIDILTRNEPSVIETARFMTDAEREKAYERLSMLNGDSTLRQLKSRLQTYIMNSYRTSAGQAMTLLAQMGVSTNSSAGGNIDKTLLRGYLQIDEDQLDNAIATKADVMKELFGSDTDNDLVVDSGLAYSVDQYLKSYTQTGGIVATRVSTIDISIERKQKDITSYERHLEDYELQLRKKYGAMEGMLDQLDKSSQSLKNLSPQGK